MTKLEDTNEPLIDVAVTGVVHDTLDPVYETSEDDELAPVVLGKFGVLDLSVANPLVLNELFDELLEILIDDDIELKDELEKSILEGDSVTDPRLLEKPLLEGVKLCDSEGLIDEGTVTAEQEVLVVTMSVQVVVVVAVVVYTP